MTDCLKYNLTSNIIECYQQNPLEWVGDNILSIAVVVISAVILYLVLVRWTP